MQITAQDVLFVIDVQNDFCPGGALAVADGDAVIDAIHRIAPRFEHIVLTQDWHPANHSSFASVHPGKQPFDQIELSYGPQTLWPDHCVQGSEGSGVSPRAPPAAGGADSAQRLPSADRFLFGVL